MTTLVDKFQYTSKKFNWKTYSFCWWLIWDKSLSTKFAELCLTPNLLLDSGRVTCAPQMWAVRSPDEVKASSLSGWNLIEFTDPWWPKYCSAHCWVCIDQILAEWSTKRIKKLYYFYSTMWFNGHSSLKILFLIIAVILKVEYMYIYYTNKRTWFYAKICINCNQMYRYKFRGLVKRIGKDSFNDLTASFFVLYLSNRDPSTWGLFKIKNLYKKEKYSLGIKFYQFHWLH